MPRGSTGRSHASKMNLELAEFSENLNSSIVKGLRGRTRRVNFTAKIQISSRIFSSLKNKYGLKFSLTSCDDLMDDLRVVRAHFVNERDYARVSRFKCAIRNSRKVPYGSFKNGKLVNSTFSPSPYFVLNFFYR